MQRPMIALGLAPVAVAAALLALAPAAAQDARPSGAEGAAIAPPDALAPPDASRAVAAPEPAAPPTRVAIELGDVEVKVRSLRIVLTLDPERAAALVEGLSDVTVRTEPASDE